MSHAEAYLMRDGWVSRYLIESRSPPTVAPLLLVHASRRQPSLVPPALGERSSLVPVPGFHGLANRGIHGRRFVPSDQKTGSELFGQRLPSATRPSMPS